MQNYSERRIWPAPVDSADVTNLTCFHRNAIFLFFLLKNVQELLQAKIGFDVTRLMVALTERTLDVVVLLHLL